MNTVQDIACDLAEAEAFREQCRRQMALPLEARMRYGFNRVYRPVLDDADIRVFSTMKEYRDWCAANLPAYLGFQPAPEEEQPPAIQSE